VLIPCFAISFERDEGERLIGGPPSPDQENPDNIISVFINNVIDPDNPFGTSDAVRILLLQFSSLLVEQASHHIHDAANKYVAFAKEVMLLSQFVGLSVCLSLCQQDSQKVMNDLFKRFLEWPQGMQTSIF